jgi:hypothetical protein
MVRPGEAAAFKAQKAITANSELTIRYTEWLECKLCIRRKLKQSWHFDCCCPRCDSVTDLGTYVSSPKCDKCDSSGLLVPIEPLNHESNWECEKCQNIVTFDKIEEIEENAKKKILWKQQQQEKTSHITGYFIKTKGVFARQKSQAPRGIVTIPRIFP